jgi:hypothetical protein
VRQARRTMQARKQNGKGRQAGPGNRLAMRGKHERKQEEVGRVTQGERESKHGNAGRHAGQCRQEWKAGWQGKRGSEKQTGRAR